MRLFAKLVELSSCIMCVYVKQMWFIRAARGLARRGIVLFVWNAMRSGSRYDITEHARHWLSEVSRADLKEQCASVCCMMTMKTSELRDSRRECVSLLYFALYYSCTGQFEHILSRLNAILAGFMWPGYTIMKEVSLLLIIICWKCYIQMLCTHL